MSSKETEIGKIPTDWRIVPLGKVADVIDPHPSHRAPKAVREGLPFAGIGDIDKYGNIDISKARLVSKEIIESHEKNYIININSIGYGRVGTVGKVVKLRDRTNYKYALSPTLAVINPGTYINASYLYALLRSDMFFNQVYRFMTGSTRPSIGIKLLRNIKIPYPPHEEQHIIGSTIKVLDNIIELNNRTNQVLEEMAQAIFKHWFVDFEFPNQDGQPYKSSGGAMIHSELGDIPEGWRVGNFTDIVDVCGGGTPKTSVAKYWNGEISFFTPKDSSTNYYVINTEKHLTEAGLENCNSQLYPANTVFITARGTVGKISLSARPMAINQSCYALKSRNELNPFFVHQLIINTVNALKYKANGAVFNAIVTRDFNSERVVISPADYIKRYEIYIKPLYDLMRNNVIENQTLSAIRNTLLPKLMSGEIRVPVEEVV